MIRQTTALGSDLPAQKERVSEAGVLESRTSEFRELLLRLLTCHQDELQSDPENVESRCDTYKLFQEGVSLVLARTDVFGSVVPKIWVFRYQLGRQAEIGQPLS